MKTPRLLFWTCALLLAALCLAAQAPAQSDADQGSRDAAPVWGDRVAHFELTPERPKVRPGDTLALAVTLWFKEGWHGYPPASLDPAAASPTTLALQDPDGALSAQGEIQWPEPHDALFAGQMIPAYEGKVVVYVPVRVAADAALGAYTLRADIGYLACDDQICLFPTTETVEAVIEVVGPEASTEHSVDMGLFGDFDISGYGTLTAFGASADAPEDADPSPASTEQEPAPAEQEAEQAAAEPEASAWVYQENLFGWNIRLDFSGPMGVLLLLALAGLGGFLLNLTPCVLPVIPIKIMGLSQAAGNPARSLVLGISMFLGIVAFWMAIGLAIVSLSGFTSINSLFMTPWFGIGVGLFIAAMGVGMMGLFTVQLPKAVYMVNPKHDSLHGSFLFGVMTAVLSTPCTAPFMGGAAAAVTRVQNTPLVLGVFGAIAAGMGLPYLILAAKPKLVDKIPRTGPSSELVKQVMGLMLLAVAVFFGGTGLQGLIKEEPYLGEVLHWWIITGIVGLTGVWLVVRTFRLTGAFGKRFVFTVIAIALAGGAYLWAGRSTDLAHESHLRDLARETEQKRYIKALEDAAENGGALDITRQHIPWAPFEVEEFEKAIQAQHVVVVDFTADW